MISQSGDTHFVKGIFVTEHHEDALFYLHRAIGSSSLPFEGNILLHFDSSPDMACPSRLKFNEVYNRERVLSCVTSETWIMPLLVAKHFNKVFWFKPPWSPQFFDGIYEFTIGRCPEDGTIKVSCKENYFVCDGHFCPEQKLLDRIPIKFIVLTVGISSNFNHLMSMIRSFTNEPSDLPRLNEMRRKLKSIQAEKSKDLDNFVALMSDSEWVLDVDMAFFASLDPVKIALETEENFALYRKVYLNSPASADDDYLEEHMKAKKKEFAEMYAVYEQYFLNKSLPRNRQLPSNLDEHFAALIRVIERKRLDWRLIHEHGVSMGDSRLPHHPSSDAEISYLLSGTERILSSIKRAPQICTIARSSEFKYCVPEKVDNIQSQMISKVKSLFPRLQKVILDH